MQMRAGGPYYGGDDDGGEQVARPIMTITLTTMSMLTTTMTSMLLLQDSDAGMCFVELYDMQVTHAANCSSVEINLSQ